MAVELWILGLLFIIGVALLFELTKKVLKVLLFAGLIIAALLIYAGLFIAADMRSLQQDFGQASNVLLLQDQGDILAGFSLIGTNQTSWLSEQQMSTMADLATSQDPDALAAQGIYKIALFSPAAFADAPGILTETIALSASDIIDILKSQNPKSTFMELMPTNKRQNALEMMKNTPGDAEFRSMLFQMLVLNVAQKQPLLLAAGLRDNEIIVYPETAVFKVIRLLPQRLMERVIVR